MFLFRRPSTMPTPDEALKGRPTPIVIDEPHHVNGAPLTPPWPAGAETAIFGLGCFWGAEKDLWQTSGVISTAVGYAGGYTPNPTYEEVCTGQTGHAEVVLVVYDPAKISYEELLRIFWEHHDPTQGMRQGNDQGTQYRSAIYWRSEVQRAAAEASRDAYQAELSQGRLRRHHHGDRPGGRVLLRGALPPTVLEQEPQRLLPRPWDWGGLPCRAGGAGGVAGLRVPTAHCSPLRPVNPV